MKKIVLLALVIVTVSGLAACASPAAAAVLQSDKPRITSPVTSQADMAELVDGNSAFAIDLYQVLRDNEGNIFYSPYSISLALAMTWAGARGDTEKEMAEAMNFLLPQDRLHTAFDSLDLALASRGQGAKGKDDTGFRLHVVNATWGQEGYPFLAGYLDILAEDYGAGLRVLDFMKDPEQARITINDWVSQETEEKIKDLIPQGAIDVMTRLVLTNAIYFNAAWQYPFDKNVTSDGDFYTLDGGKVRVPMMRQTETFGYFAGDGYQVVELPYDGRELSMVILLPDQGRFDTFEESLDITQLDTIIPGMPLKDVDLSMPKFTYESSFGLKQALTTLGMVKAFVPDAADFSGMDGREDLFIQDVLHKAFIAVDETGTEAAAASGVVVGTTSVPIDIIRMEINRPFIFLIRDIGTGTILFVGRVLNPAAS
jgi:serpin B